MVKTDSRSLSKRPSERHEFSEFSLREGKSRDRDPGRESRNSVLNVEDLKLKGSRYLVIFLTSCLSEVEPFHSRESSINACSFVIHEERRPLK